MKRKIIIFLCSALCLIIIFAALNRAEQLPSGNSTAIVEPMRDKTLESIYAECPVVLIGTVKDISSVDGIGESVITLDVLEIIKGEAEAEIQQYDIPKEVNMEMGKTYMIFLDKSYITVYPRPLYTAWLKEAVLKVENGKLKANVVGSDWYLRQLPEDTDEAVEYLKSLPVTYSDVEEYAIPENFELTEENIKNSLANIVHPARFEILSENPNIIYDGAHNSNAIDNFINTINDYLDFNYTKTFIISIIKNKDYKSILSKLCISFPNSTFIFTNGTKEEKFISKEILYEFAKSLNTSNFLKTSDFTEAIKNTNSDFNFIVGSFYTYKLLKDIL